MAILHNPALLLADESTSALDTITQAEILTLFKKTEPGAGDRDSVYLSRLGICGRRYVHRVAILHQGSIVECGSSRPRIRESASCLTRDN